MKTILLFLHLIAPGAAAFAQSCNCDKTITKEGFYDGKALGYRPGQTICIAAGNYKSFFFKNIVGTASQPIKIINCGGQVTVGSDVGQSGIQFYDSKFVKLTGSGDSRYQYGISLNKTPSGVSGLVVTSFSSDFDIEKVEVSNSGFAGIMIKYDPTCNPATWRGTFAMYNIKVHDNYVHDTGGEGLYIGNSFWNSGMVRNCNGVDQTVYPHNIYGLTIYNNLIERSGCEGIQYGCAPDAQVYNNRVYSSGVSPFASYQNNGIQAGGGSSGRLYNNIVQNAPGAGVIMLGHSGTTLVYNNLITDVGGPGVFCDNRPNALLNNNVVFTNNTISNCGQDGFRLYNKTDVTTLTNNLVIQARSGKLLMTMTGVVVNQQANYYQSLLSTALTSSLVSSTFNPLPGSPLIDKGVFNPNWGITYDLDGKPRPQGDGMDIGAYEFQTNSSARLSTETNQKQENEKLTVRSFPSPCINEVAIRLSDDGSAIAKLDLYTSAGIPVLSKSPSIPSNDVQLQAGTLPTGVYIVRVLTTKGDYLSGQFIKQ